MSDWQEINDEARSGDVVLVRRSPDGETYAAYFGLHKKTVSNGATKEYPWVFLDPTNGVNQLKEAPHGVTHWQPLPR